MSLAADVVRKAKRANSMIVTAESCTGGMIAAALTDIAGSSAILDGGFVTYSNHAKLTMLGVQPGSIARFGAVSEDVAKEMAKGALARSKAQIAVAVTGIAGPGASDHKPEGRVCFGLACDGSDLHCETVEFGALGREKVRKAARDHALALVLRALERIQPSHAPSNS